MLATPTPLSPTGLPKGVFDACFDRAHVTAKSCEPCEGEMPVFRLPGIRVRVPSERQGGAAADPASARAEQAADNAWRVFDLTRAWIAHADAKASVTIAASGIAGGTLYSVVKGNQMSGAV